MMRILVAAIFLLWLPQPAPAHPQCLDSQPPFSTSDTSYCTDYSEFGCCQRVSDAKARKRVEHMLRRVPEPYSGACEDYFKNISCLRCSPYAAHIFDSEGGGSEREFPLLCRSYCEEAYVRCRAILPRLLRLKHRDFGLSARIRSEEQLVNDSKAFCSQVIPEPDSAYCYPAVFNEGPRIPGYNRSTDGVLGNLCALPIAQGLRNPLAAVHAGDGSGRLFIVEQLGLIRVLLANNTLLEEPFLDISGKVLTSSRAGDERGLLGLAFHPFYNENDRLFVYYSTLRGFRHFSQVSEFTVRRDNPNVANASSERSVFRVSQPRSNHNGGQLLFKDGYLLIMLGDGGGAGDRFGTIGNGQNRETLHGSILRIDVDSSPAAGLAYAIPPDNPYASHSRFRREIFAYGLRNPWRCSIDRGDPATGEGGGRMFCGDVGQNAFEEIDIIENGGNYGWRAYEGHNCFDNNLCRSESIGDVIAPIDVYNHQIGLSVTGGYVYRGCLFPNLRGLYIFADYFTGRIFSLRQDSVSGGWERAELAMGDEDTCTGSLVGTERRRFVLSFGEDEDGELYVLTTSRASPTARGGVVYQLIDPSRRNNPRSCRNTRKLPL